VQQKIIAHKVQYYFHVYHKMETINNNFLKKTIYKNMEQWIICMYYVFSLQI